jgi:hypothetical protein
MSAPDGQVSFEYDRCQFTMVFDMKAIAFFEREADCSILVPLRDLANAQDDPTANPPKLSHVALLVQSGLRAFHPEISLDKAMRMASDPAVQAALGTAQRASQPQAGPDDRSIEGNVQTATRSKTSGRGKSTSAKRSKRD